MICAVDPVDGAILRALTADARLPFRELGERVGLSPNAAAARVRRLKASGAIVRFTVELGAGAAAQPGAGPGLEVLIDARMQEGTTSDELLDASRTIPEIIDAVHLTGPYDAQLRALVPDAAALDRLLRLLKQQANVAQTSTRLVLRRA